jgi:hypothetical protein
MSHLPFWGNDPMKSPIEKKTQWQRHRFTWLLMTALVCVATASSLAIPAAALWAQDAERIDSNDAKRPEKPGKKPGSTPSESGTLDPREKCKLTPGCVKVGAGSQNKTNPFKANPSASLSRRGSLSESRKKPNGAVDAPESGGAADVGAAWDPELKRQYDLSVKAMFASGSGPAAHISSSGSLGALHTGSFCIVPEGNPVLPSQLINASENAVVMRGELPSGSSLRRFIEINNGFVRSFPSPRNLRELERSKVLFLSAARSDHEETLAILDASSSVFLNHFVINTDVITRDPRSSRAAVERRLRELEPGGTVYLYGDDIKSLPIESMVRSAGAQLVRRSTRTQKDLVSTAARLREIENRKPAEEKFVFLNGLPRSREAVQSMGLLAGNADPWLDFKRAVDDRILGEHVELAAAADEAEPHAGAHPTISTREEFLHELQRGDSDVFTVVAHSTEAAIYVNGARISVGELQSLPDRAVPSARPRLLVLVSCNAGKSPQADPSTWQRIFSRNVSPLAELMVRKGWFDEVIGPNHEIGVEESLELLDKVMEATRTEPLTSISLKGWVRWAYNWIRLQGVAS